MNKNIVIVTALPFRLQGNQSLLRFTKMFLSRGYKVTLFSTGQDFRGENVYSDPNLTFIKIPTLSIANKWILTFLSKIKTHNKQSPHNILQNHYTTMKSCTIIPPFGVHSKKVMYRKWISFIANILDNIYCLFYITLFFPKTLFYAKAIIGYEYGKALCAKWLSLILRKKYINKYQGTILTAAKRNISDAKKYYPDVYYGTTKSDLCLMVNDGTDGEFYAKHKGCKNIRFAPHGIGANEYKNNTNYPSIIQDNTDKFILLNNASGSRWKRPDRVIRALSKIPPKSLQKILLICTYLGDDRDHLIEYAKSLGLSNNIIFMNNLNHIESNALIQHSDALIMTNDMSNLGNPVLEAIYYGTPVISLDDGSLDGFIHNNLDGYLIPINSKLDEALAKAIETLYLDNSLYNSIKENISLNQKVFSAEHQQEEEFHAILQIIDKE